MDHEARRERADLWLIAATLAAGALGSGCTGGLDGGGDPTPIDCDLAEPASVRVGGGTAQTGFLDLQDGDEMTVVLGPQGLYMVTPSLRARGLYPGQGGRVGNEEDPEIVVRLYLGDELVGGSAVENMGLTAAADGSGERLGIFAPFTVALAGYVDQLVTLRAEVNDACGRSASGELQVMVRQ